MFVSEYWDMGHPDDMGDNESTCEAVAVSEDAGKLVHHAMERLNQRFKGEDFELRSQDIGDGEIAVQFREEDKENGEDGWCAYYIIRPVEVL